MFTMLKKGVKYIPSRTPLKNMPQPNIVTYYEPYIGCTHKPCFAVEVSFYYLMSENFESKRYYDLVTIYASCSSPKEAVDYAMETWEKVAKNKNIFLRNYELHFVRISCVYVKIDDNYWKNEDKK